MVPCMPVAASSSSMPRLRQQQGSVAGRRVGRQVSLLTNLQGQLMYHIAEIRFTSSAVALTVPRGRIAASSSSDIYQVVLLLCLTYALSFSKGWKLLLKYSTQSTIPIVTCLFCSCAKGATRARCSVQQEQHLLITSLYFLKYFK